MEAHNHRLYLRLLPFLLRPAAAAVVFYTVGLADDVSLTGWATTTGCAAGGAAARAAAGRMLRFALSVLWILCLSTSTMAASATGFPPGFSSLAPRALPPLSEEDRAKRSACVCSAARSRLTPRSASLTSGIGSASAAPRPCARAASSSPAPPASSAAARPGGAPGGQARPRRGAPAGAALGADFPRPGGSGARG